MIAGGGGYDGPTALKNTPRGSVNRMDSIKRNGTYSSLNCSTACWLQGVQWKLLLMFCSQGKPGVRAELMQDMLWADKRKEK